MLTYLAPAAVRLLGAVQNVGQIHGKNFGTSLCLSDKGVPYPTEPPFDSSSTRYLEEMYKNWLKDKNSVHASWDAYFRASKTGEKGYMSPPSFSFTRSTISSSANPPFLNPKPVPSLKAASAVSFSEGGGGSGGASGGSPSADEHMHIQAVITSYQIRGHLVARTNPLDFMFDITDKNTTVSDKFGAPPADVLQYHSINSSMFEHKYKLPPSTKIGGGEVQLPLKEIVKRLELAYCRHIGVEYMHINEAEQRAWIRERIETPGAMKMSQEEKRIVLTRLAKAVLFEAYLKKKWPTEKRFGLEGCEVLVPCMKTVIDEYAMAGAEMVVIGMPHRGRLNVLVNVCHKPLDLIFAQFRGLRAEDEGAGDVKYHLGVYNKREHPLTKKSFVTVMLANPSHLEIINPVVAGRTKAEQFYKHDPNGDKVMPIVVHGDASICGEGIVYETINLANLKGFGNGGTIHFIVNNQVGFTTDPEYSRSSHYCSDIGKYLNAPIFHVNADDPESAYHVAKMAAHFRQKFHKDVLIDLVGYRRHGHNELDEPNFTQPLQYAIIRQTPDIFEKYSAVAVKEGVTNEEELKKFKEDFDAALEEDFQKATKLTSMRFSDWIDSPWKGFFKNKDPLKCEPTGVPMDVITHIAKHYSEPPPDFEIHKGVTRVLNQRQELVKNQTADWSMGEALAIGSLLKEGIHVRLSGEDVQRGTFSHRHHVVHHQTKPNTQYQYLANLFPGQAEYHSVNSPISEYGVLGFEHGYSMSDPNALVIWEAQFGDFANNACPMFDCLVASGQWKFVRQSGIVCLLPHGLEGQGPEHSSGRIERFLQLSDDDEDYLPPDSEDFAMEQLRHINWIVANCTIPANIFHILRRQMKMPFRKPLILFTPKSLLRHPEARSKFEEMQEGTEFRRLIPPSGPAASNAANVQRLIFCSGKVYFELMKTIKDNKMEEKIAVARVEQICPFPYDLILKESAKYNNAQIAWAQEEHKNSGSWSYVAPRFDTAFEGKRPVLYIGRAPSASTASGNKFQYQEEYKTLMADVVRNVG